LSQTSSPGRKVIPQGDHYSRSLRFWSHAVREPFVPPCERLLYTVNCRLSGQICHRQPIEHLLSLNQGNFEGNQAGMVRQIELERDGYSIRPLFAICHIIRVGKRPSKRVPCWALRFSNWSKGMENRAAGLIRGCPQRACRTELAGKSGR
jgi:hypothetical protein